jgi:DNA-binding beta-propeller fold protein YncE
MRVSKRIALLVALVASLAAATPALAAPPAQFGTEGSGAGQFVNPSGVAVDQESGDVYVADRNNNRVDEFGPGGEFLLAWGWGVADGSTEALQTCTTACFKGLEGPGAGEFASASAEGIAVDNDPTSLSYGDVYVVDAQNHRVQKFGPEGEFKLMFGGHVNATTSGDICLAGETCQKGTAGVGAGEFEEFEGRSIALGSTGTVYVGDEARVQLFSEAGVVAGHISLPAGAGLTEGLAVDSGGDVYVKSSALAGVREYDSMGTEQESPRDEAGNGEYQAFAVGAADELFVNDFEGESHHILSFDAAGTQTASFDAGAEAQDAGKHGIAYSGFAKALYVLNEGSIRIVTPPPPGSLVLEGSEIASEIQPTTVKLNAMVNPEGEEPATYRFEYGTTTGYDTKVPVPDGALAPGFVDQPVSVALTGLQPSTLYHFRVVSINTCEKEPVAHPGVKVECVTEGPDQTFTTLPPVSIESTSASEVNDESALLEAELNPHGQATEYHFEYDTTPYGEGEAEHGTKVPVGSAGSGSTDVTRSAVIQGLEASTPYHYRIVAHNTYGTVTGPDRSFTTQSTVASVLPDGRAWELVSPPNKHGSPLESITEEGGVIQAAANGDGFAYVAKGPINSEPRGVRSLSNAQLLAARGAGGWATQDITTPHEELSILHAGFPSEYKLFSEDLSAGAVEPEGVTPLSPRTTERTFYLRSDFADEGFCTEGCYRPLITSSNVLPGAKFGGEETEGQFGKGAARSGGVEFRTATPDLSHVVFESPQVLAAGFAPGFESVRPNLYELSGESLQLVSVLPSGKAAAEAGLPAGLGHNGLNMRGALSNNGERVVFETNTAEHLYLRDTGLGQTVQLDEPQPGAAGGKGRAVFQAADSDGSKVFFTDGSRLTTDSTASTTPAHGEPEQPDLYMCEVTVKSGQLACALTDLSVDHNADETANVQGEVSAIDTNGTHVYFAADGILTSTPNVHGEVAAPGDCNSAGEATCNLYEYDTDTHTVSLVAVLSSEDNPDWDGNGVAVLGNLTARSSPNGDYFAFMSQRSLTGYDNRDAHSDERDAEVFELAADSGKLSCVSCDPTGARPEGVFDKNEFPGLLVDHPKSWVERRIAGSIPGWTLTSAGTESRAIYQSRYLANSGRMFFNSADALVPQDTNKVEDVYEYEPPQGEGQPASNSCTTASSTYSASSGGCVSLISSGTSKEESAFLDASENGNDAFFLTASRLTSSDVDSAFDVYDAHVCSTESRCPPPPAPLAPACQGDACQNPVAAPNDATPGSLTFHGPGNQTPPAAVKAKAKPPTRAQKLAKALKACRKKRGKKRRGCEGSARRKLGPVKKRK